MQPSHHVGVTNTCSVCWQVGHTMSTRLAVYSDRLQGSKPIWLLGGPAPTTFLLRRAMGGLNYAYVFSIKPMKECICNLMMPKLRWPKFIHCFVIIFCSHISLSLIIILISTQAGPRTISCNSKGVRQRRPWSTQIFGPQIAPQF